jgi:hypothetical protein
MPITMGHAASCAPGYNAAHLLAGAGGNLNTQSSPILMAGMAGLLWLILG